MNLERFWHQSLHRPYRLYATAHGDISRPVVVMLHGIAASSEDWGKLIPLLLPTYRCVTIDLLGFAQSPKPQWSSYEMDDHLQSIEYTIRRLGIQGPFILIGHSLGSLLATRYSRRHPQRVRRLLLLSPPVYPPLASITNRTAQRRTNLLLQIYKFLRTHPRMTPQNIRRLSLIIPLPRSIIKDPATWLPFFRSLEHCIEQQTIMQDIRDITAPIDIFYGSLDTVVIGDNVRQLAKLRDVTVHTFTGNHSIGRTYAKVIAQVLGVKPPRQRVGAILKKREKRR